MRIRSLIVAGILVAVPSLASAIPVLRPGELSVGAEILPNEHVTGDFLVPSDRGASPGAGFNVRYSFDDQVAVIGSIGLAMTTIGDDVDDPPLAYAVGVGAQFNVFQSSRAAFLFRGGLQFVPRCDDGNPYRLLCADDQELGVRVWAGPGVEARVAEPLSIQFYTSLLDLQLGGETRFDLEIVPSLGLFLYF